MDSFLIYARSGLEIEYLGDEWFALCRWMCDEASRRGMKVWLYDEHNWPSGTCKGRVPNENDAWRYSEYGVFRNADGSFKWTSALAPRGWVNVCEPDAVRRFIELTHEEYARRLAPWFEDGTIIGIFTDEPGHPVKVSFPEGLYYDQIGCSHAKLCHVPEHGHPLGGGTWWADGYRAFLGRERDKFSAQGVAMTIEGSCECYIDVCDGFLVVTAATVEDVPLLPAVYSGYAVYFGQRQNIDTPFDSAFPLMAREFTWGVVNGWNAGWKSVVRVRDMGRDVFGDGFPAQGQGVQESA